MISISRMLLKLLGVAVIGLVVFKVLFYIFVFEFGARFTAEDGRPPVCYETMIGLTYQPGCK